MAASDPPTSKQLRTLRHLAGERGQSFAYPKTAGEASREIRRLLNAARSHPSELAADRAAVGRAASVALDAARVRDDEVEGYGSSATWRYRS